MKRSAAAAVLLAVALLAPTQASATQPAVITVDTSIGAGLGLNPGESWPSRLAQRTTATVTDMSLPGGAYTANLGDGDNLRRHVDQAIAAHPDVIVLGGPVNDLVRLTDVTPLRQAVFDAASAVQAAGIRVVVMGILPFTDCNSGCAFPAGWWGSLEPRRDTYNQWAAAMYGAQYVDVSWSLHETYSYRGDGRWYRDGLHPTRVGAALVAEAFPVGKLTP